jgi:flagella basal body P-ring formation protein FlgA
VSALLFFLLAPAVGIDPLAPLGGAQAPVKAERVVRRGETVTLRIRQGALTISTPARALGDAAAGERVRLMVTATRRTLDAVAEGPGVALLSDR